MNHDFYMKKCLALALKGKGNVAPNPLVGSVIVCNGEIIGEGYHEEFGKEHAEVNAINSVKDQALLKQSTIYVNLEPCSHFGKTPPCSDLIIKKGIPHVVIGAIDDHEKVAGKGDEKLEKAGIKVEVNILKEQCLELNKRFYKFHNKGIPYVILKWAESKDGFISKSKEAINNGENNWITGNESKVFVHQQRATEQAILVGKNTVINDNPSLTTRLVEGKNPLRVIIGKIDENDDLTVLRDQLPTLIFNLTTNKTNGNKEWIRFDGQIESILKELATREIQSVIIEGGTNTIEQFIQANLWDEAYNFVGDIEFKNEIKAPKINKQPLFTNQLGKDKLRVYFNK